PEYMAPEQMQTGKQLDARADVYALGAIAYHMLGGRPPFIGDLAQLVAQKLMQSPPSLQSLRSDIPAEVDRVIFERSPEKLPGDRRTPVTGLTNSSLPQESVWKLQVTAIRASS